MKTLFDFMPTQSEIDSIAYDYLTMRMRCGSNSLKPDKDWYTSNVKPEWALFDLALLYESRNQPVKAAQYWEQIPAIAQEYQLGRDYEIIPA